MSACSLDEITEEKELICNVEVKIEDQPLACSEDDAYSEEQKPFTCTQCNDRFSHEETLSSHLLTHAGENPYVCTLCNERCFDEKSLASHVATHTGFSGEPGSQQLLTKALISSHTGGHVTKKPPKPFACNECESSFSEQRYLYKHLLTHKKDPLVCQMCSRRFLDEKGVVYHPCSQKFGEETRYVCTMCSEQFTKIVSCVNHMRAHTKFKAFNCKECNTRFDHLETLSRHVLEHRLSDENAFAVHLTTHNGEKPLDCSECVKLSSKKSCEIQAEVPKRERTFVCPECNKAFFKSHHLKSHILTHKGEKPFVCPECDKCYSSKADLNKHLRVHRGEKNFICDACGKQFFRKSNLLKHFRVHTKERPYNCGDCGKNFAYKSGLNYHRMTHTGRRPHVCSICNQRFCQAEELKYHVRRKHTGEKPFSCTVCGKQFVRKQCMKKHLKSHNAKNLLDFVKGIEF